MSLGNAIQFVQRVSRDEELRNRCIQTTSREGLLDMLQFDEVEFEDAINMQLVKCQTHEEADVLHEIRMWFSLL